MPRQPSALLAGVISRGEAFERAEMLLLVPAQDTGVAAGVKAHWVCVCPGGRP